jgi:CheY-like chemotaxis protein
MTIRAVEAAGHASGQRRLQRGHRRERAGALRVLGREKVDLVISDLRMDEMDGLQLFSEIQKGSRACR